MKSYFESREKSGLLDASRLSQNIDILHEQAKQFVMTKLESNSDFQELLKQLKQDLESKKKNLSQSIQNLKEEMQRII